MDGTSTTIVVLIIVMPLVLALLIALPFVAGRDDRTT